MLSVDFFFSIRKISELKYWRPIILWFFVPDVRKFVNVLRERVTRDGVGPINSLSRSYPRETNSGKTSYSVFLVVVVAYFVLIRQFIFQPCLILKWLFSHGYFWFKVKQGVIVSFFVCFFTFSFNLLQMLFRKNILLSYLLYQLSVSHFYFSYSTPYWFLIDIHVLSLSLSLVSSFL